jgi:hypothetical protein
MGKGLHDRRCIDNDDHEGRLDLVPPRSAGVHGRSDLAQPQTGQPITRGLIAYDH